MTTRRVWLLAVLATALSGGWLDGSEVVIRSARPLGPYLEVRLGGGEDLAVLLPATPACVAIARPEASARWVKRGFPGRLEPRERADGAEACEAAGILELARWRDRQPRPDVRLVPRKTARFTLVHRDGRRALLRGRFVLAGLVGMPGGQDLVAVVADDETCAPLASEREATLEYRVGGREAYRLVSGHTRCTVLGFARPPEGLPPP